MSCILHEKEKRIDKRAGFAYNMGNFIGQFETILSVNKTREERMGALRSFFIAMNKKTKNITTGALIGAMYVALCYLQNALIPGSASWAIQFRAAEALCVLAFFTPSAISGLTIGCLLFNISFAGALPLDPVVGPIASCLAAAAMYLCRKVTIRGFPLLGLLMPAVFNALLVGWELTVYIGDAFWLNAVYVAIGEVAVLLTLGTALYYTLKKVSNKLFA